MFLRLLKLVFPKVAGFLYVEFLQGFSVSCTKVGTIKKPCSSSKMVAFIKVAGFLRLLKFWLQSDEN